MVVITHIWDFSRQSMAEFFFNLNIAALMKSMTGAKTCMRMKLYPVISLWLFVPAQLSIPSPSIFNANVPFPNSLKIT